MEDKIDLYPISHGNKSIRNISFMVNVAWGNEYLIDLLNVLKEKNINLTFFLEGRWVEKYPDLALMIKRANHEIGNHAYSHKDMRILQEEEIRLEITKTNEIINRILEVQPKYFTPPFGSFDTRTLEIARKSNMTTVLCSLDTMDWKVKNSQEIIDKILPNLKNGSIILMHPTESSLKALPFLLEKALEKNYKIVNINEMFQTINKE